MSAFTLPIRFSHLRAYGRSALHGFHARQTEAEQTVAMQRGTAVHALLFGNRKVAGWDGAVRRGKAYDEFAAANPDVEILTASEYEKSCKMAQAVRDSKVAAPYLEGVTEQTIRFKWYGRECRATPDIRGHKRVVELKTSNTSDPERFPWQSLKMKYHAQLRMQQIATAEDAEEAYVIVVESAEPFPVTVFRVTDEALVDGEKCLVAWMERLVTCEKSQYWPPYVECVVPLDVPRDDELEYDEPAEDIDPQLIHGLQA